MNIGFFTENKGKWNEIQSVFANEDDIKLVHCDRNLPEIQSLDLWEIVEAKILKAGQIIRARNVRLDGLIVEDTGLYLGAKNFKLPGPFIKFYLETLGVTGIAREARLLGDNRAEAVSVICLLMEQQLQKPHAAFFEGKTYGSIVEPRGDKDFGWGPIFEVEGTGKTFGEMELEEKAPHSMRIKATLKLREHLKQLSK